MNTSIQLQLPTVSPVVQSTYNGQERQELIGRLLSIARARAREEEEGSQEKVKRKGLWRDGKHRARPAVVSRWGMIRVLNIAQIQKKWVIN